MFEFGVPYGAGQLSAEKSWLKNPTTGNVWVPRAGADTGARLTGVVTGAATGTAVVAAGIQST